MLTEADILDRYEQSLGEADRACQQLGRNADPEYLALRSPDYLSLQDSLKLLEGCCRQMSAFRSDARWIKLGVMYARAMRIVRSLFEKQKWQSFREIRPLFRNGLVIMEDLRDKRTGKAGPVLPTQSTEWLQLPDLKPINSAPRRMMN